ncbi:GNAT family N-acetyltransferase, partial [Akkermansiaceae bacterium]|nr:GNAT family N-acetyltransferase [Akkermansiaceae bacterium]
MNLIPRTTLALTGVAGVGKTSTAHIVADQMLAKGLVRHGFIVQSDTVSNLAAGLRGLQENSSGVHYQPDQASTQEIKEHLSKSGDWLLVLENMDRCFIRDEDNQLPFDSYRDLLPDTILGGRILITTRDNGPEFQKLNIPTIELNGLSPKEGARFLIQRIKRDETEEILNAAKCLSKDLGGLPLAIDQAAGMLLHQIHQNGKAATEAILDCRKAYQASPVSFLKREPLGEHIPVYRTVTKTFEWLCGAKADGIKEELPAQLLRLFSVLAPSPIPLAVCSHLELDEKRILESVCFLEKLRLLDFDRVKKCVSMHRLVRMVLRFETEKIYAIDIYQRRALNGLNGALKDERVVHLLHQHIERLSKGECRKEIESLPKYASLLQHLENIEILSSLVENASWEYLVFGSEHPSYSTMRILDQGNVRERERCRRRLSAIYLVCDHEQATHVFAAVFFLIHYWWDVFLDGDYISKPILELWQRVGPDSDSALESDRKIIDLLNQFQEIYPAKRQWKERDDNKEAWQISAAALQEVNELLKLDSASSLASRYSKAVLNIYLASSLCRTGHTDEALSLNIEAERQFLGIKNLIHFSWAKVETVLTLLYIVQRCEPEERPEILAQFEEHYEEALIILADQKQDDFDFEALSDLHAAGAQARSMIIDHQASIVRQYLALVYSFFYILSERDRYSLEVFSEQIERMTELILRTFEHDEAIALQASEFLMRTWGKRMNSRKQEQIRTAIKMRDEQTLTRLIFLRKPALNPEGRILIEELRRIYKHAQLISRRVDRLVREKNFERFVIPEELKTLTGIQLRSIKEPPILHSITATDDPLWVAWHKIYMEAFPASERMSDDYFLKVFGQKSETDRDNNHLLVLKLPKGDEVLGIGSYELDRKLKVGFLWYLAIHSSYRGEGLGTILLHQLVQRILNSGVDTIFLEIENPALMKDKESTINAQNRISWYQRNHFVLIENLRYIQTVDTSET